MASFFPNLIFTPPRTKIPKMRRPARCNLTQYRPRDGLWARPASIAFVAATTVDVDLTAVILRLEEQPEWDAPRLLHEWSSE